MYNRYGFYVPNQLSTFENRVDDEAVPIDTD